MADIALAPDRSFAIRRAGPALLERLGHRAEILRRRARRNRYLALTGRLPPAYPWFAVMYRSMGGR